MSQGIPDSGCIPGGQCVRRRRCVVSWCPSLPRTLPLCSPPPVFQPQKRACASTQNTRHYSYVCLHAYTCRCVCICIYVQRKNESKGRIAGVCVVGLNLSPSSIFPPSTLSLSLSLSLSTHTHIHTHALSLSLSLSLYSATFQKHSAWCALYRVRPIAVRPIAQRLRVIVYAVHV